MKIHCKYDRLIDPSLLKDNPKNRNKHGQDQIERLAKIYKYQGIRHPIIVSRQTDLIVAGHGRKLAAILAGIKEFPIVYQDFESDDQEYAFIQSDNAIALWADLDLSGINHDLQDLGPEIDLDMLGIKNFTLDFFEKFEDEKKDLTENNQEISDFYTNKIETPIYEPKGEQPPISDLLDLSKTLELENKIKSSNIPDNVKTFLTFAAQRHLVFNYHNIAEYYAHAPKEVQELMEESALVIIDFKKAVKNGFVRLTKEINDSFLNDNEEDIEEEL